MNGGVLGWLRNLLAPPPLRPPGAKTESEFSALCIRCDRCLEVCPYGTLRPAGFGHGASVGTPLMIPAKMPCYLCMLCPPVCPTGALERNMDKRAVRIGIARVNTEACYAHMGVLCRTCIDQCPFPYEAIGQDSELHPVVTDKCVGCGICEKTCPAPEVAIRVEPRKERL